MNINVAPLSGRVILDGMEMSLDLSALDKDIQGLHWDGTRGEVSYWNPATRQMTGNEELTSFDRFQWIVDKFNEQKIIFQEQQIAQEQEFKTMQIAAKRTGILMLSDWTQLPDVDLTPEKKEEWAVYRQFIRDITLQPGYPDNIDWGTPPA